MATRRPAGLQVGEVGELSELFQWRGEVRCGIPDFSPKGGLWELADAWLDTPAPRPAALLPTATLPG